LLGNDTAAVLQVLNAVDLTQPALTQQLYCCNGISSVNTADVCGDKACFAAAGFTGIHILAHVDVFDQSLSSRTLWRNVVAFSPTAPATDSSSGSYSYADALLQPAAEALNNVINRDTAVEFTLAGEQGLSTWSHPRQYVQLMQRMRSIVARYGLELVEVDWLKGHCTATYC
jgi:hypothetical protein